MLMEEVSKEELNVILVSFKRDKSPRPYDWLVEFLLVFDDLLEEDIITLIEESSGIEKVLGVFNATFLALILKRDKPKSFNEFKPISLSKCIYKIMARIL